MQMKLVYLHQLSQKVFKEFELFYSIFLFSDQDLQFLDEIAPIFHKKLLKFT